MAHEVARRVHHDHADRSTSRGRRARRRCAAVPSAGPDWLSRAAPCGTSIDDELAARQLSGATSCRGAGRRAVCRALRSTCRPASRVGGGDAHQLEADPVGVPEVDRVEPAVVDDADGLDALAVEAVLCRLEPGAVVDAQRQVVDPRRGRGVRHAGATVEQVEEREHGTVAETEEDVHVRVLVAGARHAVVRNRDHHRQAEHVLVEVARLLGVATPVRVVVQSGEHRERAGAGTASSRRHHRVSADQAPVRRSSSSSGPASSGCRWMRTHSTTSSSAPWTVNVATSTGSDSVMPRCSATPTGACVAWTRRRSDATSTPFGGEDRGHRQARQPALAVPLALLDALDVVGDAVRAALECAQAPALPQRRCRAARRTPGTRRRAPCPPRRRARCTGTDVGVRWARAADPGPAAPPGSTITRVPRPRPRATQPSATSRASAARLVTTLTPKRAASSASPGSVLARPHPVGDLPCGVAGRPGGARAPPRRTPTRQTHEPMSISLLGGPVNQRESSRPGTRCSGQRESTRAIASCSARRHRQPPLRLHRDLPRHEPAPVRPLRRQPRGGVAVALLRVRRAVDREQVERVVGERASARRVPLRRTLLPRVGQRDHVVDLHRGRVGLGEHEPPPGVRIVQHARDHDAAVRARPPLLRRRGRGSGRRRGCRSRCGRRRPTPHRTARAQ